ncbi:hypothetical protein [Muriicola sp. Z0-33]|uniref:hypothetical protein n=1 Tax=Muriicola sp. Z0-33 TaxID=2816957 RepID=UPI00223741F2|nr:hypothetical protein [Muriicola sp. Z0-33]MCW5514720.1 hypothetical protein [Muriicola sp. Z0-33]
MNLDFKLYKQISDHIKGDIESHEEGEWYQYSYKIYTNHNLDTIDDFWKIVAFAYSWMPTIPTIHFEKIKGLEEKVFYELKKLQQGDGDIVWLFNTLSPVINNSVVGTSKALHFIAPNRIPIYDSRVKEAWSKLFDSAKNLTLKKRPDGNIGKVLFYTTKMNDWLKTCNLEDDSISLRDLELALYYYGKNKTAI